MKTLHIPCEPGEVSDGYHTFNELYEHRCALFLALMASNPELSWISEKHHDGSEWEGWFIAGMRLPTGDVTYHLPIRMWSLACDTGADVLAFGREWDGHTAADVVFRFLFWVQNSAKNQKTPNSIPHEAAQKTAPEVPSVTATAEGDHPVSAEHTAWLAWAEAHAKQHSRAMRECPHSMTVDERRAYADRVCADHEDLRELHQKWQEVLAVEKQVNQSVGDITEDEIDELWKAIDLETRCEMCRDSFNIGCRLATGPERRALQ